jgi:hypothetical protein
VLGEKRRACSVLMGKRRACSVSAGKPEVKISLERHRSRGDNIKMNLQEQNGGC